MTAVHLHVGIDEAFACLRAYARDHDRALGEVAGEVVSGRLGMG